MPKDSPTSPPPSAADIDAELDREFARLLALEEPPAPSPPATKPTPPKTAKTPKAARASRRGSEERQRSRQTLVRWSEEEFQDVDSRAGAARLTLPSWLRELALEELKRQTRSTRRAPLDRAELAKILGQLGKIGGNMNQIAHAAHLGLGAQLQLNAALKDLRAVLPVILEALGRKP